MTFARVRALIVVGVLVTAAAVFVVVALVRDSQRDAVAGKSCPEGAIPANITLPREREVKVKVFNGTDSKGLASQVTEDFKNRKFQVEEPDDSNKGIKDVAVLRFGPKSVGAAHLLKAYFLSEAEPQFDKNRQDDIVDVIIGSKFKQLATRTEVNQSLVELGAPVLPPGTCEAEKAQ
jgi:hypothetical protein